MRVLGPEVATFSPGLRRPLCYVQCRRYAAMYGVFQD